MTTSSTSSSTSTTIGLQLEQALGVGTLYADLASRNKKLHGLTYASPSMFDSGGDTLRDQCNWKVDSSTASTS